MAYDWTQLGIKEITNLFLYGTPTTPSDLASKPLNHSIEEWKLVA